MSDPKNTCILIGGLVAEPEISNNLVKLRLAVDWAGSERDGDDKSGYFNVKYWTNREDNNVKFVKSQLDAGNFKKGSNLAISGRMIQERWKAEDGNNRSTFVLYADAITYSSSARPKDAETTEGAAESTSVPDAF